MGEEAKQVDNAYREQLVTARSQVEAERASVAGGKGSATTSIASTVSDGWQSPAASRWLDELSGRGTTISGKFDSLVENLTAEINSQPLKVDKDDPRADRGSAPPMGIY